jgi:hypothetical protein
VLGGLAVVVLAVAVAAAVAVDGAGSPSPAASGFRGDGGPSSTEATAATTTTSTPPPTSASPVPPSPEAVALAALLPDDVLAGFTRVPDAPATHLGPLDLAAAASIERDEPAERALLETRHFVRGHARAWRAGGERVAYASLYEFASPADAAAYLEDGLTTISARGARLYDVAAPAGGRGFSQAGQAAAGAGSTVAHGVVFVRGARFALVFVSSPDSSVGPAEAARAATAVASALGG